MIVLNDALKVLELYMYLNNFREKFINCISQNHLGNNNKKYGYVCLLIANAYLRNKLCQRYLKMVQPAKLPSFSLDLCYN